MVRHFRGLNICEICLVNLYSKVYLKVFTVYPISALGICEGKY